MKPGEDHIIIEWITCNGATGWEKMLEFLNIRKQEFIRDIKVYCQFHRGEDCVNEDEYDDYYEEIIEVLESPDTSVVEDDEMEGLIVEDDDDVKDDHEVSVEEIMNQLRMEVEEEERNFINGEPQ
jgi:hypothetical protein